MARKKRHTAHRSAKRTSSRKSFFRTRLFYFLGITIIALLVIGQYAKTQTHVSSSVLSDSSSGGGDFGGDSSGGGGSSGGTSAGTSNTVQTQQTQMQQTSIQQNVQQNETETQNGSTTLKTKVEDNGGVKIEGAMPGFQFKLDAGDNQFHIEDSQGRNLQETEQKDVENELENEGVDISTEDGKFAITKDKVKAVSELPLSVDKSKTQILITTPNGKTVPVILPNVAIENLSRVGFLTASGSAQVGSPSGNLTLATNANGIPVYYVPAFKNKNFLGFIPVQIPVTTEVSAETGAVMGQQQNLSSQLLDALSF